jgi:hypothetical protein
MSIVNRLLGRAKKFERNSLNEIVVLVHKDVRHHAPHGFINVTHHAQRIKNAPVAFVFPDLPAAPALTLRLMTDLYEALHAQGYIPHELVSYGTMQPMFIAEHASDDAFVMATPGFDPVEFARAQTNADPAAIPRSLLKQHPDRRHGMHVVQPGEASYGELLDAVLVSFKARCARFDEETREVAAIRFDQIISNGVNRNDSVDEIKDRLETALQQMHEDNAARRERQQLAAGRVAGAVTNV